MMTPDEIKELRSTIAATLKASPEDILAQLENLGWTDLVAQEPEAAITTLFTEHGRLLSLSTVLDQVVISALDLEADAVVYNAVEKSGTVTGIVIGASDGTLAIPALRGLVSDGVTSALLSNFDTDLCWSMVRFPATSVDPTPGQWTAAEAAGQRALAAEIVGIASEMLRLAMSYTSSRHQYGHALAQFQTVRHRYADAHVAIEAAGALLRASFLTLDPRLSRVAKASAGKAAEIAAMHSIQTFGAIGSTAEHELHHYVARSSVLDSLLGSSRELTARIGTDILASGDVPILSEV